MANPIYIDILSAAANGDGAAVPAPDGSADYTLTVWGTFNSATVKLQMTPDNGTTWVDVKDASFLAPGTLVVRPAGWSLRGSVAGGTAGVSINARMFRGGNT